MNAVRTLFFLSLLPLFFGCTAVSNEKAFDFFLDESCMITNFEQDNRIEGTQLRVVAFSEADSSITVELPSDFALTSKNYAHWTVGWGSGKPYFDAGLENIRGIRKIDVKTGKIHLDKSMRGTGFPRVGQRIVFWNTTPSGYEKIQQESIIQPNFWPTFHGESIGFSSIVYDPKRKIWITLVHEVDSDWIQIYAAISSDLLHWKAGNDGKPILIPSDFKQCRWAGKDASGKFDQAPMVSEIIYEKGTWYVFMDGYDRRGKRHIGLATTNDLLGKYAISTKPILSPQNAGNWNDQSVFCAKVAKRSNDFVLFFDGRNEAGYEQVGRATSTNLKNWKMDTNPVLDQHEGWRSAAFTSEPNYVDVHGDTIFLMTAGAKQFQESFWHQHFTHRSYMDRSGNVNDAQLGVFISLDGGKTFAPHPNNPIFVNAYSDKFENEHMGGNLERIETDSMSYLFYQAKSSFGGMKYSIFLRSRAK